MEIYALRVCSTKTLKLFNMTKLDHKDDVDSNGTINKRAANARGEVILPSRPPTSRLSATSAALVVVGSWHVLLVISLSLPI